MPEPVKQNATYQDVLDAPPELVAEVLNGRLHLHSRPAEPHITATSNLGAMLLPPFKWGRGGPGGWVIQDEPEIHTPRQALNEKGGMEDIFSPDLAGWRAARYAKPTKAYHEITPDWICEVASPSTAKIDKEEKMPLYHKIGVRHLWIVDPVMRSVDIYARGDEHWELLGSFVGEGTLRAAPFEDVELNLQELWD